MKRVALAVALLIALATCSQGEYRDGVAAYSRGDYATALQEFKPLAEQGHAKAQAALGAPARNAGHSTLDVRYGSSSEVNANPKVGLLCASKRTPALEMSACRLAWSRR